MLSEEDAGAAADEHKAAEVKLLKAKASADRRARDVHAAARKLVSAFGRNARGPRRRDSTAFERAPPSPERPRSTKNLYILLCSFTFSF